MNGKVTAISFEFTTLQRNVAYACIARLAALGSYTFNIALGESQTMTLPKSISGDEMANHVAALSHAANSGDIYAFLETKR